MSSAFISSHKYARKIGSLCVVNVVFFGRRIYMRRRRQRLKYFLSYSLRYTIHTAIHRHSTHKQITQDTHIRIGYILYIWLFSNCVNWKMGKSMCYDDDDDDYGYEDGDGFHRIHMSIKLEGIEARVEVMTTHCVRRTHNLERFQ